MHRVWLGLAVTAAMVFATGATTTAHACSAPAGGCQERIDIFGEVTARPTNACILVQSVIREHGGFGGGSVDAALTDAASTACGVDAGSNDFLYVAPDGTTIALRPGVLHCPTTELAPFTEYRVVGPSNCGQGPPIEHGRFTTGSGPDTTPPEAPHDVRQTCSSDSCEDSGCCGPFTVSIRTTEWAAVTDDGGLVLYSAGGGLQHGRSVVHFEETSGRVMFDTLYSFASGLVHRGRPSGVRAYDIAGNVSAVTTALGCASDPDAGPPVDAAFEWPDANIDAAPFADAHMSADAADASSSCNVEPVEPARVEPASTWTCRAAGNDRSAPLVITALAALLGAITQRRRR